MNTDLLVQHALDHLAKAGVNALTESERTLVTAWTFEAEVRNSGFTGYYCSHRGDLAAHAPAALRAIGASQSAAIATEANAVFGPEGPPVDHASRRAVTKNLGAAARQRFEILEERYSACEEDVDELLEQYVASAENRNP